jgi:nitrogen fixation/metabolism regulation signal transduction histidine kinase
MRTALDMADFQAFKKTHAQQVANLTEPGEPEATANLGTAAQRYEAERGDTAARQQALSELSRIHRLNRDAIVRANDQTYQMTESYGNWLAIIGTIALLLAFTLLLNFPGYIARPVEQLTLGIRAIAARNYAARIYDHPKDEFGALTRAFNDMAERLEQWEQSSLAAALRDKRRMEGVAAAVPDAILGLDEAQRLLFINPAAAELLSLNPATALGKSATEVALHNDLLRELLKNEGSAEALKIFAQGAEHVFEASSRVISDEMGIAIGRVIQLRRTKA